MHSQDDSRFFITAAADKATAFVAFIRLLACGKAVLFEKL
jgi:hypothetical protein